MIWAPYTEEILERLPKFCHQGRAIWRARVPLIYFHIVEWHLPHRVMRQFGLSQDIPDSINTEESLHMLHFQTNVNWDARHNSYIQCWNDRLNQIVPEPEEIFDINVYLHWYRRITRRFMSRECLVNDYMVILIFFEQI